MAATHHELGNLKLFVDCNGIQNDDFCEAKCACSIFLRNGMPLGGLSR